MPKKIIFAFPSFAGGGAERVMINIANKLDKQKFEVAIMVLNENGPYKGLVDNSIKIINLNTSNIFTSLKRIVKEINIYEPELILTTLDHYSFRILSVKNKFKNNPKVIVRLNNTASKQLKNSTKMKRCIRYILSNWLYRKADQILAQCKEMQLDFIETYKIDKNKTSYIFNPLDLKFIRNSITDNNPYNDKEINFLAVGRLTSQKGFDVLLDSFAIVNKKLENARLTIIGSGELEESLKKRSKILGLENKVDFTGFVNNPYDYYYYSDVYVLSSRYEGFPNSLLEALACGTKVTATKCKSGPKEILEDKYGILVNVNNTQDLAQGMIDTYENQNLGAERAEYFDINKIVMEYESLLMSL